MKKKLKGLLFIFISCIALFSMKHVYAASANLTISSTSVYVGDPVTVTVSYYAATWNLHVSGAVNDSVVGYEPNGNDTSGSQSWSINTSSPGTYSVSLSGDITDADVNTSNASGYVTVTVSNRPAPPTQPTQPSTPAVADTRSANNNLKSISVDGYELVKVDDTHYTLSVKNSVDRITIKTAKEDDKATVSGDGLQTLKVGDNHFDVVVTAENGTTKTYSIDITRRDTVFTLAQLKDAIKDAEDNDVDLVLGDETSISSDDLKTMKDVKKIFHITKYDDEKNVLYTWNINGNQISDMKEISLTISSELKNRDLFEEVMEYVDGRLVVLKNAGKYPKGTTIKVFVGDKYKNGDVVNLFTYNEKNKTKKLVSKDVKVTDGFVLFTVEEGETFFLTKASFEKETHFNVFIPICIIEFLIIIALLLLKGKKKKPVVEAITNSNVVESVPTSSPTTVPVSTTTPEVTSTSNSIINGDIL